MFYSRVLFFPLRSAGCVSLSALFHEGFVDRL